MNRSVAITLGVAFFILILLFIFMGGCGGNSYNWRETYKASSKQPYGTHVMKEMLKGYNKGEDFKAISSKLSENIPTEGDNSNYVFIGEAMFMDSSDVANLLDFVARGNTAFISAKSMPYDLMFYLYYTECDYTPWDDFEFFQDTIILSNFNHDSLESQKDYDYFFVNPNNRRNDNYTWHYIDSIYFCGQDEGFTSLGTMKSSRGGEYTNFAMVHYKDPMNDSLPGGNFFIHTNPLMFTNFHLLDARCKDYTDGIFTHLEDGPIYWDQKSQIPEARSRRQNAIRRQNPEMTLTSQTPLIHILNNKHLSWAWYSLLGLAVLYLMFRTKRRQRIIPVEQQNVNTSLEFVNTMGALYYNKPNHKRICQQKMKMFLAFVRNRYGIPTRNVDMELAKQLGQRSAGTAEEFEGLFLLYKNIMSSSFTSDDTLKYLHERLEDAYQQCK